MTASSELLVPLSKVMIASSSSAATDLCGLVATCHIKVLSLRCYLQTFSKLRLDLPL